MKQLIEYSHIEAKQYFLKVESYFNFDLPKYFVFQTVLDKVSQNIEGKLLSDFYNSHDDPITKRKKVTYPCDFENVNYIFLNNKDGKFAYRPLQLIHPALYVSLVHKITEKSNWKVIVDRFKEFSSNPKIRCHSLPLESEGELSDKATAVNQWWQAIEQQSIASALNFEYVLHTDITDCYGSIYTHSLAWAIHKKAIAKIPKNRNDYSLIGNLIDKYLRDMACGQTNGIPQGSVLMDFIAEMVLGYADLELSEKIKQEQINDYQIIRYRDDYRIFTNNPQDAELIAKLLTEIMIELGMRLNAQKTLVSNNVVRDSIKPDKLYWITAKKGARSLQEHLLIIHELSQKFPNSGSLSKALDKYFNRIENIKEIKQNVRVLVSILVDIAYKNPRTYPIVCAILSKLLSLVDTDEIRENILKEINTRFNKIPNTGHIKIWLQRVTLKIDRQKQYEENLCKKVNDNSIIIWNSDWLKDSLKTLISKEPIVDEEIIDKINKVIDADEVELFGSKTYSY
ncbi:MAG: RNA-directed DNA polymerase [Elusimicrobia bacterium]|nr:RNA-directed DNA polymerase [Elusimicrobiota bacterium]